MVSVYEACRWTDGIQRKRIIFPDWRRVFFLRHTSTRAFEVWWFAQEVITTTHCCAITATIISFQIQWWILATVRLARHADVCESSPPYPVFKADEYENIYIYIISKTRVCGAAMFAGGHAMTYSCAPRAIIFQIQRWMRNHLIGRTRRHLRIVSP